MKKGSLLPHICHELRLVLSEVSLPFWVGLYICLVILEQMIELDLERAFSRHIVDIEVSSIGCDARSRLYTKGICTGSDLRGRRCA